tara:strand:+ start:301 stop:513 length:213 start_codon:yes stop_codon:yes gene_type:complete
MIDKHFITSVIAIEKKLEILILDLDLLLSDQKELYYERVDKRAIEKILENLRETFDRSDYSESEFMKQFL